MERQPAVRLGLGLLLQASGLRVIGTAQTPEQAEAMILARRPDVALLDAAPALDSALARNVLAQWCEARLLAYVSGPLGDEVIEQGFDAGLAGFVSKAGEPAELMAAIRHVATEGVYLDRRFRPNPSRTLAPRRLTKRQREILKLLAAGFTSEQVAQELVVSKQTIDTHVRNLMARLGARTRTHAVALAAARREIELPHTS